MPSPFPGMDPYLEGSLWTSVHVELAIEIAAQLAPRLRPRYLALPQKRFVLTIPEGEDDVAISTSVYPDTAVARPGTNPAESNAVATTATAAKATTVTNPTPLHLKTVIPEHVPLITIEIRDTADRLLVTAIEVLSPTNKHGDGRQEYLERRRRFLISSAHLIEIDLLRRGDRVPMQRPLPGAPYFVLVGRAELRPQTQVWPIGLAQRLPEVPVPLLDGDPDVPLDLQQVLTNVYDRFGYDLAIDYSRAPEVPLGPEYTAWAEERLRAWRDVRQRN